MANNNKNSSQQNWQQKQNADFTQVKNATKKSSPGILLLCMFLIATIIVSSSMGLYAWARYTKAQSGNANAQVAKWSFKLTNGTEQVSETANLAITRTDGNSHVEEGKLAPGTYGQIPIGIDATETETNLEYTVTVSFTNLPTNLKLYSTYDSGNQTYSNPLTINRSGTTATVQMSDYLTYEQAQAGVQDLTMYWNWPYESAGNNAAENTANDRLDTQDAGKIVTMQITAVGTEVMGQTYRIQFNGNQGSGTMADMTVPYGVETTLPTNAFTRANCEFKNWDTEADGSGTTYSNAASVQNLTENGETVTLYAQWTILTYTVQFDENANGSGSMSNQAFAPGAEGTLTTNAFARTGYTFTGWNTKADGTGNTYANEASLSNIETENTTPITLYAQWQMDPVKYAVQIYGINQDVDASGNTLGLTFGPAVGANYNNAYVTHTYEETAAGSGSYNVKIITHTVQASGAETTSETYLTNSAGTNVTRTTDEMNKYNVNLHNMTWAQIVATTDKTVFTDCMLCGDTKSVSLTLNSTIASGNVYAQRGDGAGMLYSTINSYYRIWNPSTSQNAAATQGGSYGSNARNAGGYKTSHIRASLIGAELSSPTTEYAGDNNLTSSNCLYSCIESDLQNVITAKKVKYVTGTSKSSYQQNSDIADKIWLFSQREVYGKAWYSGGTTEGIGNDGVGYTKFSDTNSKYYMTSGYNINRSAGRTAYYESGSTNSWWLRSLNLDYTDYVHKVFYNGNLDGSDFAYNDSGLAFGFCIR